MPRLPAACGGSPELPWASSHRHRCRICTVTGLLRQGRASARAGGAGGRWPRRAAAPASTRRASAPAGRAPQAGRQRGQEGGPSGLREQARRVQGERRRTLAPGASASPPLPLSGRFAPAPGALWGHTSRAGCPPAQLPGLALPRWLLPLPWRCAWGSARLPGLSTAVVNAASQTGQRGAHAHPRRSPGCPCSAGLPTADEERVTAGACTPQRGKAGQDAAPCSSWKGCTGCCARWGFFFLPWERCHWPGPGLWREPAQGFPREVSLRPACVLLWGFHPPPSRQCHPPYFFLPLDVQR